MLVPPFLGSVGTGAGAGRVPGDLAPGIGEGTVEGAGEAGVLVSGTATEPGFAGPLVGWDGAVLGKGNVEDSGNGLGEPGVGTRPGINSPVALGAGPMIVVPGGRPAPPGNSIGPEVGPSGTICSEGFDGGLTRSSLSASNCLPSSMVNCATTRILS